MINSQPLNLKGGGSTIIQNSQISKQQQQFSNPNRKSQGNQLSEDVINGYRQNKTRGGLRFMRDFSSNKEDKLLREYMEIEQVFKNTMLFQKNQYRPQTQQMQQQQSYSKDKKHKFANGGDDKSQSMFHSLSEQQFTENDYQVPQKLSQQDRMISTPSLNVEFFFDQRFKRRDICTPVVQMQQKIDSYFKPEYKKKASNNKQQYIKLNSKASADLNQQESQYSRVVTSKRTLNKNELSDSFISLGKSPTIKRNLNNQLIQNPTFKTQSSKQSSFNKQDHSQKDDLLSVRGSPTILNESGLNKNQQNYQFGDYQQFQNQSAQGLKMQLIPTETLQNLEKLENQSQDRQSPEFQEQTHPEVLLEQYDDNAMSSADQYQNQQYTMDNAAIQNLFRQKYIYLRQALSEEEKQKLLDIQKQLKLRKKQKERQLVMNQKIKDQLKQFENEFEKSYDESFEKGLEKHLNENLKQGNNVQEQRPSKRLNRNFRGKTLVKFFANNYNLSKHQMTASNNTKMFLHQQKVQRTMI
ncbi:UNKNOWN [Stylonychia lemnae]|uniref:Uncharacterized protein n=1 Tax=Stylonychia lemnae TaxID=5949 RepID=A0A078B947_STYLE|nr:UNKNOWN [Stylonychia lemnae]|eukprot:CDW89797.1 UNKNOWN [Stylonychia lemnae]